MSVDELDSGHTAGRDKHQILDEKNLSESAVLKVVVLEKRDTGIRDKRQETRDGDRDRNKMTLMTHLSAVLKVVILQFRPHKPGGWVHYSLDWLGAGLAQS